MKKNIVVLCILLFSVAVKSSSDNDQTLTLEIAKKMAEICEKLAVDSKWRPIVIAIYDSGGNLKLLHRQDNSFLMSLQIAKLKASSSAGLPMTTRQIGDLAYKNKERGHGIEHVPGVVIFPGGVPIITKSGAHLGGIGVSGATADQDEECAKLALSQTIGG
ncbi:MAG: heme-binding protein [Pseudomonadota bacterium]|nr:heme-binding protein [Pseudomonadota bacterium]